MQTILNVLTPLTFFALMAAESLSPARPLPGLRAWRTKGVLFLFGAGAIVTNAPRLWAGWAARHRVADLSVLGTVGGALSQLLAVALVAYAYHLARHRVPALWRLHQLHHSSERLDVASTFIHHPLDTFLVAGVLSLPGMLLGLSADAAALAGYIGFTFEVLTHANIRTPRWLGYIVQRPEQHSVHHARGVHAFNYGMPWVDLLFGTFRNPAQREDEAGFWDGASARLGTMLLGVDVSAAADSGSRRERVDQLIA
jgi:sterol desaturase/sphingolipid hydroxylase (fatty acid hydroxylase superfamily)